MLFSSAVLMLSKNRVSLLMASEGWDSIRHWTYRYGDASQVLACTDRIIQYFHTFRCACSSCLYCMIVERYSLLNAPKGTIPKKQCMHERQINTLPSAMLFILHVIVFAVSACSYASRSSLAWSSLCPVFNAELVGFAPHSSRLYGGLMQA